MSGDVILIYNAAFFEQRKADIYVFLGVVKVAIFHIQTAEIVAKIDVKRAVKVGAKRQRLLFLLKCRTVVLFVNPQNLRAEVAKQGFVVSGKTVAGFKPCKDFFAESLGAVLKNVCESVLGERDKLGRIGGNLGHYAVQNIREKLKIRD